MSNTAATLKRTSFDNCQSMACIRRPLAGFRCAGAPRVRTVLLLALSWLGIAGCSDGALRGPADGTGPLDTTPSDASTVDAASPDASPPDANIPDGAISSDVSVLDDAGSLDGNPPDAGLPDAGTPDDASPPDVATPDTIPPDAGTPDAAAPCSGVAVAAGSDLSSLAASHAAGTTFCLAAGVYQVTSDITPKSNQRFVGALGSAGQRLSSLTGNDSSTRAFSGGSSVVGVEIRNLIIEHFASPAQQSPVSLSWPPTDQHWLFDNVESRYNHGIGLSSASNSTIRNSYIHHNLQMGLNGQGGGLVENNEISYNNYKGTYDWGWEGGGAKWVNNTGLVVRNNHSHHNCGPGLWTDGPGNSGIIYEGNLVHDNHGPGIMHEIGGSAIIRNNTAKDNAWGDASGLCTQPNISSGYSGGILISESHPVEVHGNTLSGNDGGIIAIDNDRGSGMYVKDLWVHDNDITIGAGSGSATGCLDYGPAYDCYNNNNKWDSNHYHVGGVAAPFFWAKAQKTWAQWKGYGFDANGTID